VIVAVRHTHRHAPGPKVGGAHAHVCDGVRVIKAAVSCQVVSKRHQWAPLLNSRTVYTSKFR
jgi:hypothetical protein